MTHHTVSDPARGLAVNALVRTVLQGLVVVAVVAGWAAVRDAIGADGPIEWGTVGRVGAQAAGMAVLAYGLRALRSGHVEPVSWQLDTWVRAGRTLASGLAVSVAVAGYQAVAVATTGGAFDFGAVSRSVLTAAGMAVAAWVHRLADRVPVPTAAPPAAVPSEPIPVPLEPYDVAEVDPAAQAEVGGSPGEVW